MLTYKINQLWEINIRGFTLGNMNGLNVKYQVLYVYFLNLLHNPHERGNTSITEMQHDRVLRNMDFGADLPEFEFCYLLP